MKQFWQLLKAELKILLAPAQCALCGISLFGRQNTRQLCRWCTLPPPRAEADLCPSCGEPQNISDRECDPCRSYPLPFNSLRWSWEYQGLTRSMISAAKYRPSRTLAQLLVAGGALTLPSSYDLVLSIPPRPSAMRKRLFALPDLMAAHYALQLGIPWDPNALTIGASPLRQTEKTVAQRLKLEPGTFGATVQVRGRRVLLVDDVITTGTTISAAVRALQSAGAVHVDVVALARSTHFNRTRAALSDRWRK